MMMIFFYKIETTKERSENSITESYKTIVTEESEFIKSGQTIRSLCTRNFLLRDSSKQRRRMAKSDETDIVVRLGCSRGGWAEIVGLRFYRRRRSVETCRKSRSPAACGCHPDSRLNERFVPGARQKNAILILEIPESVHPQHMSHEAKKPRRSRGIRRKTARGSLTFTIRRIC